MELPTIQTMSRAEVALAERFKNKADLPRGNRLMLEPVVCDQLMGSRCFPEGCSVVTCIPLWFYDSLSAPAKDLLSEWPPNAI
jgi:hypothetical protein